MTKPTVDWFALAPSLALLAAASLALLGAVLVPAVARKIFAAVVAAAGDDQQCPHGVVGLGGDVHGVSLAGRCTRSFSL